MNDLGHNNPPGMAETAESVARDLSIWMGEHPVIETEEDARGAKVFIDRAKLCVKDLEDDRQKYVRPLNERIKQLNDYYRGPRELLYKVCGELEFRLEVFLVAEEQKRQREADEAQLKADAARRIAEDAERLERERLDAAAQGELGVDVAGLTESADQAFSAFEKAQRQAAIAERDSHVKIGGGFTRALSLRSKDKIEVIDAIAAIKSIGLGNEIIDEAIIKAARAYKKVFGKWPDGLRVTTARGL